MQGGHLFTSKRFHTATTIQKYKVITFGGCHSDYVHLNDLNLFDMTNFVLYHSLKGGKSTLLQNASDDAVVCTKIDMLDNIPSTRWGHAAVSKDNKLYILGGRND